MQKTYINWDDFHKDCESTAAQFINKEFDAIIALSRGGLVPARIMANIVKPKEFLVLGLKLYNEHTAGEEVQLYQDIESLREFDRHSNILIVDDISDSGKTLRFAFSHVFKKTGGAHIVSATPYIKPNTCYNPTAYSKCFPDDEWIVFPFEKD